MTSPPDWLNSVLFLLIGIWVFVRRVPVKKEAIGGVAIPVQDPSGVDWFLENFHKFQWGGLALVAVFIALKHLIEYLTGHPITYKSVGL